MGDNKNVITINIFVSQTEIQLKTKIDGEGNALANTESYNAGTFGGVLRYSMEIGYINKNCIYYKERDIK